MASSEGADDGWELTEDDLIALGILSSDAQQQPVAEEFPPNIYELFRHYNATYFQVSACTVTSFCIARFGRIAYVSQHA